MSEGAQGILILCTISLIISLIIHFAIKSIFAGSIISAVLSSFVFQILNWIHIGYLDPFFLIASMISLSITFFVSIAIGLPFKFFRLSKQKNTRA